MPISSRWNLLRFLEVTLFSKRGLSHLPKLGTLLERVFANGVVDAGVLLSKLALRVQVPSNHLLPEKPTNATAKKFVRNPPP